MGSNQSSDSTEERPEGAEEITFITPSLAFESLTFSDGTTIQLANDDVVVFVGPNNAGKSAALKELEIQLSRPRKLVVTHGAEVEMTGSLDDLLNFLELNTTHKTTLQGDSYTGYRFSTPRQILPHIWGRRNSQQELSQLVPLFCNHISTENRIIDSNPPKAIELLEKSPQHPIHILQANSDVEDRISGYFRRAFGKDLIVFHGGGSVVPLMVGERPQFAPGEHPMKASYLSKIRASAAPLSSQGDGMRSFATVILNMLTSDTFSVSLLDEPEAFLHPPQARLLGEFIAKERTGKSQLFIATHSIGILDGLLATCPEKLRVVRIQRDGDINRVKELDNNLARSIASDPLMKYSSVFDGLFHERVFICESDADCMFYSTILDLPEIRGERQPDVLFIHAGGKHRMAKLATALRALDVPVSIIADVDALSEKVTIKNLYESLGGDWVSIEKTWQQLKNAIEEKRPPLTIEEASHRIGVILRDLSPNGTFPTQAKTQISSILKQTSPWEGVKQGGKSMIPAGQPSKNYSAVVDAFSQVGLWIVPVGELEGFCKTEGGHGPNWVQSVLENRDLATDGELSMARTFVRKVWLGAT